MLSYVKISARENLVRRVKSVNGCRGKMLREVINYTARQRLSTKKLLLSRLFHLDEIFLRLMNSLGLPRQSYKELGGECINLSFKDFFLIFFVADP